MTKNDFIHRAAIALYGRDSSSEEIIAKYAKILADEVEKIAPFDWLEKQGQVKESEISQPIKETSKENDNSLTNKDCSEIQNGIILDGVAYELTGNYPDNAFFLCKNCELREKCRELTDETLCEFFGAASYRNVFRKMERKL